MQLKVRELLTRASQSLVAIAGDRAAFEARLLLAHVLKRDSVWLIQEPEASVSSGNAKDFFDLVSRRTQAEPMAYLLGEKEFLGNSFLVDRSVLIPRPETETLVLEVQKWLANKTKSLKVLELGVGSGCILLSLALIRKNFRDEFLGVDVSDKALEMAKKNRHRMALENVQLKRLNILTEHMESEFDLILSNPPYIPSKELESLMPDVRDYEPKEALDGGVDGLVFYRRILEAYWPRISSGGLLAMETHEAFQRDFIREELAKSGLVNIWIEDCHIFCERKD